MESTPPLNPSLGVFSSSPAAGCELAVSTLVIANDRTQGWNAVVWTLVIADGLTPHARVGCAAVELDWVLFDADGVIQGARAGLQEELAAWGGSRADEFLRAVGAADVACLTGNDFGAAMLEVLRQFEISAPLEEVIDRQFWIEVRPPMLDAVRTVRDLGLRCGLATNQQNLRGTYMRKSLGFETIFDEQFYSYELGFAKPEAEYFQAILDRIDVAPDRVLFIDDHDGNVAGAREIGIHSELFPRDGGVVALTPILARYGIRL